MPVTVHATTRRLSQEEFTGIVYEVMGHVFKVHQEFGRYFDENIYHREIARRCNALNAFVEVPIEVRHGDFRKMYFADLLVGHDTWDMSNPQLENFRDAIVSMLRDLGTSLDVGLYEEILTHILGGENAVMQKVEVRSGDHAVDTHAVRVAFPGHSFNVTAVREDALPRIEGHLRKFLAHTPLHGTHWINIRHRLVTFRTLRR